MSTIDWPVMSPFQPRGGESFYSRGDGLSEKLHRITADELIRVLERVGFNIFGRVAATESTRILQASVSQFLTVKAEFRT